ncbi:MAG: T9SS type A sorting domain-containing protein [bacterium]|nr:T9SS type A sorting domain-containing protein [bacterium]
MKRILLHLIFVLFVPSVTLGVWESVPSPGQPGDFDGHEVFLSGDNQLFTGSFRGLVYSSINRGDTWELVANDIGTDCAPVVSLLQVGDWLFMSRSYFGVFNHRSHFNGADWSDWEPIGYQDGEIRSLTSIDGILFAVFSGGIVNRSDDLGMTWAAVTAPESHQVGKVFSHEGHLFTSQQQINGGQIYRSDNLGESWVPIGTSLTSSYICSEIHWQDQFLLCVYHMGGDGTFWSSPDFGETWQQVLTMPTTSNFNGLAIMDDGRLAVGASGGYPELASIWLSNDLVEWENFTHDLPQSAWPFNSLTVHDGWFFKSGGTVTKWRAPQTGTLSAVEGSPQGVLVSNLKATPNPFNPRTDFSFTLTEPGLMELVVFNVSGQRVAVIADGYYESGEHQITWQAKDTQGRSVPSGVYMARLTIGNHTTTKRLALVR